MLRTVVKIVIVYAMVVAMILIIIKNDRDRHGPM